MFLIACAGGPEAPRSLKFDAQSNKAIVLLGTSVNHPQSEEIRAGRSFSTYWQEYDPASSRLTPGGETFITEVGGGVFSKPEYLTPTVSVLEIDPGSYALVGAGFPHLASTFVAEKKSSALTYEQGRRQTWTYTVDPRRHIDPAAPVERQRNFMFSVAPGEVLYIGHFEFLKWEFSDSLISLNYFQNETAAREALADFPRISGVMGTYDPRKPPQEVSR